MLGIPKQNTPVRCDSKVVKTAFDVTGIAGGSVCQVHGDAAAMISIKRTLVNDVSRQELLHPQANEHE